MTTNEQRRRYTVTYLAVAKQRLEQAIEKAQDPNRWLDCDEDLAQVDGLVSRAMLFCKAEFLERLES